jgi:hypothetical protein
MAGYPSDPTAVLEGKQSSKLQGTEARNSIIDAGTQ